LFVGKKTPLRKKGFTIPIYIPKCLKIIAFFREKRGGLYATATAQIGESATHLFSRKERDMSSGERNWALFLYLIYIEMKGEYNAAFKENPVPLRVS